MTDYKDKLKEIQANNQLLFGSTGEVGKSFMGIHGAAIKDAALPAKTKELEALAIAIAVRCEGCIIQHTKACIKMGASFDEISETVGVAIMMGGGPSTVYGGKALDCAKQFMEE